LPQSGRAATKKFKTNIQWLGKRSTDKAYHHLKKHYVKTKILNPLVVFPSVGHKKIRFFSNFRESKNILNFSAFHLSII
jgi:hypothetical protein